ncbi:hypothetical protein LDENG_00162150 [Lucifuga dentata]|nr:hypothetical protein LDENG_00162150 [Lucifuga dentata]
MSLEEALQALPCHFTWGLTCSRSQLLQVGERLEDIGPDEGFRWLGHIYNLQGFVRQRLGREADAHRCFGVAAEAFRQVRNTVSDEGPWLVVNYGNQAWLHFLRGETAQSRAYVSQVDALQREYPSPSPDSLHPEVYAEKAWTLMNFGFHQRLLAAEYFQKAIRMQPDVVEWHTGHVLALDGAFAFQLCSPEMQQEISEKMRIALKHDPENLYLAALCLEKRAEKGGQVVEEARDLAKRVLNKPVSLYSGISPLLRVYRKYVSMDEATDLAEEALERHPGERYLKRCVATCYKWRIRSDGDNPLKQSMVERAISLHNDVISLYPHSSLKTTINLAEIYTHSSHDGLAHADRIYDRLLHRDLDPAESQILYNCYAKYLNYHQKDRYGSIEYHMRAAEIPEPSSHRSSSITILERIRDRNRNRMCGEIQRFLENLRKHET